MRKISILLLALAVSLTLGAGNVFASGDNLYQWLHDDDGDGIPNCLDPDWYPPLDGDGYKNQNGRPVTTSTLADSPDNGDSIRLQLKLQDGSCGECPDTCGVN